MIFNKITIIILTLLFSINLYGEYKLSVKGGMNYSIAELKGSSSTDVLPKKYTEF